MLGGQKTLLNRGSAIHQWMMEGDVTVESLSEKVIRFHGTLMNGTKLMMIHVDIKYNYLYMVIKYFFLVIYYSEFVHMEATPSFQAWGFKTKEV